MSLSLASLCLRILRKSIGVSQETIGAQVFMSDLRWAQNKNGTHHLGDELLEKLTD